MKADYVPFRIFDHGNPTVLPYAELRGDYLAAEGISNQTLAFLMTYLHIRDVCWIPSLPRHSHTGMVDG